MASGGGAHRRGATLTSPPAPAAARGCGPARWVPPDARRDRSRLPPCACDELARDRQPEAGARRRPCALERPQQPRHRGLVDADALVEHAELRRAVGGHLGGEHDPPAGRRVAGRVGREVRQHLARDGAGRRRQRPPSRRVSRSDAVSGGQGVHPLGDLVQEVRDAEPRVPHAAAPPRRPATASAGRRRGRRAGRSPARWRRGARRRPGRPRGARGCSAKPLMTVSGVRRSCETFATNSPRARSRAPRRSAMRSTSATEAGDLVATAQLARALKSPSATRRATRARTPRRRACAPPVQSAHPSTARSTSSKLRARPRASRRSMASPRTTSAPTSRPSPTGTHREGSAAAGDHADEVGVVALVPVARTDGEGALVDDRAPAHDVLRRRDEHPAVCHDVRGQPRLGLGLPASSSSTRWFTGSTTNAPTASASVSTNAQTAMTSRTRSAITGALPSSA